MFVTSYSVTYYIYVPGKPGICFHDYCDKKDQNRNIFDLFSPICWVFEGKKNIYIAEQGKNSK